MSKLRPETRTAIGATTVPNDTALYLIRDAIAKRRILIHGRLHDGRGHHCAIGCFWEDNPKAALNMDLIDEVAAVNDSVPPSASPQERWKKVNSWLRWKLNVLAHATTKRAP